MVSVIIPTYNRGAIIEKSIRSVLNQTYKDFELIIVDDGSSDNTREVVEAIGDERIKYHYQQNAGASAARNAGIMLAQYDYIAFQDSDDIWHEDKLEKQMNAFENASSRVGIVYSSYTLHAPNGDTVEYPDDEMKKSMRSGFIFPYLLIRNMIGTPTMLIKKEVFEKVGMFDTSLRSFEDYELALRICKEYHAQIVDEVLVDAYIMDSGVNQDVAGIFGTRCLIVGNYKKELLEYEIFDVVVSGLLEDSKRFGYYDATEKCLLNILQS